MRKTLLLLFLLGQLPALATTIVVGLRSDKLISWGVWEREGTSLKHYLLLYNKSSQPLDLVIRAWNSQAVSSGLNKANKYKILYHSYLPAKQLIRVRYPKTRAKADYMEYFENAVSVGLLPHTVSRPDAAALGGEPNRYYTNESANSGELSYWLAFNSLHTPPALLRLTLVPAEFRALRLRRGEETYGLVKLYATSAETPHQPGTLDSLFSAGLDPTIARLDSAHRAVMLPVRMPATPAQLAMVLINTENIFKFFRYNEQRQLVADKLVSGAIYFLPFFPQ